MTPSPTNLSATGASAGAATTALSPKGSAEYAFTTHLASLVRDERRAALAALRRGLGKRPGEAAEMFPYVVPWLGNQISLQRQDDYFLIASLFATHQISWPADSEGSRQGYTNLGESFRRLKNATDSESIEQRFVALLNTPREDLPYHLRHAASLLRAHDIPIDWPRLLIDLGWWAHEDRGVQRAWAQAFWRHDADASGATKSETSDLKGN